jgi:hypothetical protein
MFPPLIHRLNDLYLQDVHAGAARDRLVSRGCPVRFGARISLARSLMAALAAVTIVLGTR